MSKPKLRKPQDLSDEQLSQEIYNCAAFMVSACEEEEDGGGETSLSLLALLLLRAKALVQECADESLESLAEKATDDEREVLLGTRAEAAPEVAETIPDEPA